MGGARFPTHIKWAAVRGQRGRRRSTSSATATRASPAPSRTASCSAGPRTCSSRGWSSPASTAGATRGYIYIRHEYHEEIEAVEDGDPRRRGAGLLRQEHLRIGHRLPGRGLRQPRRLHLRRGIGPARGDGGPPRRAPEQAPLPDRPRPLRQADDHQQRRDVDVDAGDLPQGRPLVPRPGGQRLPGALVLLDLRRRERAGRLRGPLRHHRPRPRLPAGRRHERRPAAQGDRPLRPLRRLPADPDQAVPACPRTSPRQFLDDGDRDFDIVDLPLDPGVLGG